MIVYIELKIKIKIKIKIMFKILIIFYVSKTIIKKNFKVHVLS